MITTLTALQVVQRAFTQIAQGPVPASGTPATNFDGSANGVYAGTLYQGAVQLLLRQYDPEFARRVVTLSLSGFAAPLGWSYEYTYPTDCVRVRQVYPATWDANDPQPIRWDVGTNAAGDVVIWASAAAGKLTYTTNDVTEADWDDGFTEEVVRYLGSQFAIPTAGRPDVSREFLETAGRLGNVITDRDS